MFENERWGVKQKHERYDRTEDREKYGDRIEEIFGKKDPKSFQSGKKTRKVFKLRSREELERDLEQQK